MKKYGLIGQTLSHSFSKKFFTEFFEKNEIDATYENIELPSIELFQDVKDNFDGFNVTIPYKEAIIPHLDELDEVATEIGAVNTILRRGSKWIGSNTDAHGFHQSIKPFLNNRHERALILGTGGASKAVAYVLENLGIDVLYLSQNPTEENQFSYEEANEIMMRSCKLIVNTTPLGMYPNNDSYPNLPYEAITEEHLLVDLVYNPDTTVFMNKGLEKGAIVLNGYTMLKEQALKSYKLWQGE